MPHFSLGSYRVEIGKVVCVMSFPKGRKGTGPVILVKPQSAAVQANDDIPLPVNGGPYECRLLLGAAVGEKISLGKGPTDGSLLGYGVILDIHDAGSLKDVRRTGHPWTFPCMFDGSSIVSEFVPSDQVADPASLEVYLEVDGKQAPSTSTRKLLMDVGTAVGTVSRSMSLYPGDIVGIEVEGTAAPIGPGSGFEAGISSVSVIRGSFKAAP